MATSEDTLKVLSFNVWGLAIVAKARKDRIRAIATSLSSTTYDIICLQECWVHTDFLLIRDELLQSYPFSRFFHTGALGSGLAIFARFPIISARAMPYSLSGTPQQAFAGDFFVNKAAGMVVLRHPVLGEVEVWSTHMHAAGEHPPDTRQAHRIAQSWQLSGAVRSAAAKGRYVMVMGDFNSQPSSVPIQIMRTHAGLTDSFLETHPSADVFSPSPPSALEAIHDLGMTCDSPLNTWSGSKNIPPHIKAQGGKRLDYIFYRGPAPPLSRPVKARQGATGEGEGSTGAEVIPEGMDDAPELRCVKTEVIFTDNVPGRDYSYSDHFGLVATFSIGQPSSSADARRTNGHRGGGGSNGTASASGSGDPFQTPNRVSDMKPYTDRSSSDTTRSSHHANGHKLSTLPSSSSTSAIIRQAHSVISSYMPISARAKRLHLRISLGSFVFLLALTIGSAWQPKSWLQPIFTLVGGLSGAAAVTFFYLGFVWGRWEEGLLTEVMDEMDLEIREGRGR